MAHHILDITRNRPTGFGIINRENNSAEREHTGFSHSMSDADHRAGSIADDRIHIATEPFQCARRVPPADDNEVGAMSESGVAHHMRYFTRADAELRRDARRVLHLVDGLPGVLLQV